MKAIRINMINYWNWSFWKLEKADCEVIQNQKKPKSSINEVQKKSKWEWESINHLTYWVTKSEVGHLKLSI